MSAVAVSRIFEQLGQIREHLTDVQNYAADIEDPALSMDVNTAMVANTRALIRVNELLKVNRTTTDALDADLDSQHVEGARGG